MKELLFITVVAALAAAVAPAASGVFDGMQPPVQFEMVSKVGAMNGGIYEDENDSRIQPKPDTVID